MSAVITITIRLIADWFPTSRRLDRNNSTRRIWTTGRALSRGPWGCKIWPAAVQKYNIHNKVLLQCTQRYWLWKVVKYEHINILFCILVLFLMLCSVFCWHFVSHFCLHGCLYAREAGRPVNLFYAHALVISGRQVCQWRRTVCGTLRSDCNSRCNRSIVGSQSLRSWIVQCAAAFSLGRLRFQQY